MKIGQSAGKSYAYLLGTYLGDGSVSEYDAREKRRLKYTQSAIDLDFVEAVAEACRSLSDYKVWYRTYPEPRGRHPKTCLHFADHDLCAKLVADTHDKQVIPAYVFEWSKSEKLAFIAGLMDSEGFVAQKTGGLTGRSFYMGFKSCDVWVPDFIRVLQSVGIRVGKVSQEAPRKPGYKVPTRFTIKMQSWIDAGAYFRIQRKQARVDRWSATEPYSERSRFPRRLTSETLRQAPHSG